MPRYQKLYKIRSETERYGIALAADLDQGEALTGAPTVTIRDAAGADVTVQFDVSAEANGTVDLEDGSQQPGVTFVLGPAADPATDQLVGSYSLEVQFHTDGGRSPVATDDNGELPVLQVRA